VNVLRTLRGRLAGAMLLILLLAISASALLDARHGGRDDARGGGLIPEPYQDALVLGLFSVAALALIWAVSSWSLRPLQKVSRQARAVGPHAPAARLSREGLPSEITPLVDAVNGALDRMTEAFSAERRFTENAAHELRTPLAVLGLRLQRARHDFAEGGTSPDWPAIEQDLAHMNRLVAQLLDLARKENAGRDAVAMAPVNLARAAREAAAMVLPLAEAAGRTLEIDVPDTLMVAGRADDLRDAVRNLLENAVVHGRGAITLRARAAPSDARVTLLVSDKGSGVPEPQREAVFGRFAKDARSQGSGLGLAIVREVARAHGGEVVFLPGPACCLALTLPGIRHGSASF
jgi:two-component system sensor histidine kinase QseC